MRAFITGMAGFAGSHLAEHCLASGDEVWGSSLSGDWGEELSARLPMELRTGAKLLRWDISVSLDAGAFSTLAAVAPDVIYHLAAVSKATDCDEDRILSSAGSSRSICPIVLYLLTGSETFSFSLDPVQECRAPTSIINKTTRRKNAAIRFFMAKAS